MFRSKSKDSILNLFSITATIISSSLVLLILAYLLRESFDFFHQVSFLRFFSDSGWTPSDSQFNILPMVVGTLLASFGCVLICAPLGILVTVYLYFYSPTYLQKLLKNILELALAVPSVVYGLWGLTVLVPIINEYKAPGASLLAGILILSMMVFPILVLTLFDAFHSLSEQYKTTATSIGLSRFTFIFKVILPQTKKLILTTSTLQLGRALGETMAILMVCGNVIQYPSSLFTPIRTLTSNIALEMAYASSTHKSALFATAFLLMILLCFLFSVINLTKTQATYEDSF